MASNEEAPLVKMSELARLSGVPAPTIKHYIREGLLPGPARRTSKNMAYYDASLADRVRVIKKLQQEQFLPLRVIAGLLEPAPSAKIKKSSSAALEELIPAIRAGQVSTHEPGHPKASRRVTVTEVLETMQITQTELDQLALLGLAEPTVPAKGPPYYCDADLDLIEIVHETREHGLESIFSFDILPPYIEHVRALVRFELELFRARVLEGRDLPDMPLSDIGRHATALGQRLIVALHEKLVLPEIELLAAPPPAKQAKAKGTTTSKSAVRSESGPTSKRKRVAKSKKPENS